MNGSTNEELRMLRARAYGPSPDIHDDAEAMRRLAELEDLARVTAADVDASDVDAPGGGATPPVTAEPRATAERAHDPVPVTDPVPPAPAPTPPRRMRALWAMSLVLTAVAAVAVTLLASSAPRVVSDVDAQRVGTVEANTSAEWPEFFGVRAQDSVVFADFYGLTALRQSGGAIGREGMDCIAVFLTESVRADDVSYSGPSFFGCGADPFPARVPVVVDATMPAELLDRFPLGSALEFVVTGDRLAVFFAVAP